MIKYKLSELIAKFGGTLRGEDIEISSIMSIKDAKHGDITFFYDKKFSADLSNCSASAVILREEDLPFTSLPAIITDNPLLYYCYVSRLFNPPKKLPYGIKASAVIDNTATIGENCAISDNVVIGANVKLGGGCQIYPNVVIGDDVIIGDNVTIYPNVTIYARVTIGDECILHSGVVIGSDGFGYAPDKNKHRHKIPQIGGVKMGNKVEVGANSTIDCGTFNPTIIEDGVVIDNLVQIAHNCKIGAHSVIAAHVGIAGSTIIGKYCILAGHAGIADNINICDHTIIGAFTGIGKNITKPDLYMAAYPFSTYRDYAKNAIHIRHLNEMHQRIKKLEKLCLQNYEQFNGEKYVND
ncbi:MAG: UDP-3-O-(3-hydroxymyristoyl)glucosamine N-acyltransferase [Burkholderiales bacterium]|nr:UDP-3-O-(3-hydroxymyristoyl)glucosamine N-acyltransferase [Burkholderiales bacterium]